MKAKNLRRATMLADALERMPALLKAIGVTSMIRVELTKLGVKP